MTLFLPNIPQPNDNLDFSQGQLLSNNQGLDTVFGIDHYPFSDASGNKGFHNTVTQPAYQNPIGTPSPTPPGTVAEPKLYAFQQTVPLGVLQYSRGPNNMAPTPVTSLQGGPVALGAGGGTVNILDFTGIPRAFVTLYAADMILPAVFSMAFFVWTGAAFKKNAFFVNGIFMSTNVNVLFIQNNTVTPFTQVYWTLAMQRLE